MFGWFKKWREKHETVEEVYQKRGVDVGGVGQMVAGTQGIALPPAYHRRRPATNPLPTTPTNTPPPSPNNDFLTGFLVAEALSGGNAEAGLLGGAIGGVSGGLIAGELVGHEAPTPEPVTFGGGESGGAGASGSWDHNDTPSCDTSSSSSSDSSSSCDSSSSDSGSSSSDF